MHFHLPYFLVIPRLILQVCDIFPIKFGKCPEEKPLYIHYSFTQDGNDIMKTILWPQNDFWYISSAARNDGCEFKGGNDIFRQKRIEPLSLPKSEGWIKFQNGFHISDVTLDLDLIPINVCTIYKHVYFNGNDFEKLSQSYEDHKACKTAIVDKLQSNQYLDWETMLVSSEAVKNNASHIECQYMSIEINPEDKVTLVKDCDNNNAKISTYNKNCWSDSPLAKGPDS